MDLIKLTFPDGTVREYAKGVSAQLIAEEYKWHFHYPIVAASINKRISSLNTIINEDVEFDLFDTGSDIGNTVYLRSVFFLLVMAVKQLYENSDVSIRNSIGKGYYCELSMGRRLTTGDFRNIEQKMRDIVAQKLPIFSKAVDKQVAIEMFEVTRQHSKIKLLKQIELEQVRLYFCGDNYDYFYGSLVPNTEYLRVFSLEYYPPSGIVLLVPDKAQPDRLPDFVDQPNLAQVFHEAEQWGKILDCRYLSDLNEHITNGGANEIIRVAEALHEKKLAQIADAILAKPDARVVLIAGPSSSGKTTFANRLRIQLQVNGLRPVPVSLDDYFVDRERTPKDERDEFDFEALEAIDLELFNMHLQQLLNGEEVLLPTFDFKAGRRIKGKRRIQLKADQMLLIEGIHGLNDKLTASVLRKNKFKIYISALTQLSIDNHNRIPTTEARLIRRIVRDNKYRGNSALNTLKMWKSVRRGEEKNIFPYQEDADVMFNSALIYELAVLRRYALPLLAEIGKDEIQYYEAQRLLKFLGYFCLIDDESNIPPTSILREFIGNSCFYK
ncbi:MAG: nucleoside kinase [Negativicutes bacterium]|jgi:uridine kinase